MILNVSKIISCKYIYSSLCPFVDISMDCSDVIPTFVSCEIFPVNNCLDIMDSSDHAPTAMQLRLVGGAGKWNRNFQCLLICIHVRPFHLQSGLFGEIYMYVV